MPRTSSPAWPLPLCLAVVAALAAADCLIDVVARPVLGADPAPATRPAGAGPASAPTSGATVVPVEGNVAVLDLGRVRANSVHVVIFAVENPGANAIPIRRIMPDCECISAVNPPKELAAGKATNVTARLVAPDTKEVYGSELIVMTTDPQRKIIHLRLLTRTK